MTQLIIIIIKYKYLLLIPLGFVEGHVISLVSGFLSRLGYINIFLAALCIATGNLLGDTALYWLGYHKGDKLTKRFSKFLGLNEQSVQKGHYFLHKHKGRILMISKLTNGFGFAIAILFSAGAARIPFKTYMFWNIIGECIWTGILITIGYYFGSLYATIGNGITRVFLITGSIVILSIVFILIRKKIKSNFVAS